MTTGEHTGDLLARLRARRAEMEKMAPSATPAIMVEPIADHRWRPMATFLLNTSHSNNRGLLERVRDGHIPEQFSDASVQEMTALAVGAAAQLKLLESRRKAPPRRQAYRPADTPNDTPVEQTRLARGRHAREDTADLTEYKPRRYAPSDDTPTSNPEKTLIIEHEPSVDSFTLSVGSAAITLVLNHSASEMPPGDNSPTMIIPLPDSSQPSFGPNDHAAIRYSTGEL